MAVDGDADNQEEATVLKGLAAQIAADYERNFHHKPVANARHSSPFRSDDAALAFIDQLKTTLATDQIPAGYGVLPGEYGPGDYPTSGTVHAGRGADLVILLPKDLWYPRAVRWCKALDLLKRVLVIV